MNIRSHLRGLGNPWRASALSRHTFSSSLLVALVALTGCQTTGGGVTRVAEHPDVATPQEALAELKAGNERFVRDEMVPRDWLAQVDETSTGQSPFAVVLGCIDSRVPPEVVFDQGIGDIFSARVAGNFSNTDILGSMEFATAVTGSKLIVVLGHSSCGAVKGATDSVELGNLTALLENIKPAVEEVDSDVGERSSKNAAFVEAASRYNVELTIDSILENSEIISDLVDEGHVAIVGAMYDVATGMVDFYE